MPRHRVEGRPRHRARRQGSWPGRRVLTEGVRPANRVSVRRPRGRPEYGRILRGAMLTPWFAVSVGIVVATSLTLAAPHPALTFPRTKSGHCITNGCSSNPRLARHRAPAIKKDRPLPTPATQLPARQRTTANVRAAVSVGYQLLPSHDNHFMAVIVIKSRKSLGRWSLRLKLPGAHIHQIIWARWARVGTDGLLLSGSPLPWPRSQPSEARVIIFGSGTPRWPADCSFKGDDCAFRKLTPHDVRHPEMPIPGR